MSFLAPLSSKINVDVLPLRRVIRQLLIVIDSNGIRRANEVLYIPMLLHNVVSVNILDI